MDGPHRALLAPPPATPGPSTPLPSPPASTGLSAHGEADDGRDAQHPAPLPGDARRRPPSDDEASEGRKRARVSRACDQWVSMASKMLDSS